MPMLFQLIKKRNPNMKYDQKLIDDYFALCKAKFPDCKFDIDSYYDYDDAMIYSYIVRLGNHINIYLHTDDVGGERSNNTLVTINDFCGIALHFANLNELDKCLDLMKISLNNVKE